MTDNERKELLLKAKPIMFNTEMVRAILNGRKTTTRRVVKPQPMSVITEKERRDRALSGADPYGFFVGTLDTELLKKAPYHSGDILYVRETWCKLTDWEDQYPDDEKDMLITYYRADCSNDMAELATWHPSIHMPKEAARIFLRVTDVKVERLQDIDGYGVLAEGVDNGKSNPTMGARWENMQLMAFSELWNSTIKKSDLDKYGWAANPWVWVIEFERID